MRKTFESIVGSLLSELLKLLDAPNSTADDLLRNYREGKVNGKVFDAYCRRNKGRKERLRKEKSRVCDRS